MISTEQQWLRTAPWAKVLEIYEAFCQGQSVPAQHRDENYAAVKTQWENAETRGMSLEEAFDFCRQSNLQAPFVFNNANTFAAVAKSLVEDWAKKLPPVEATILRTTVTHYVAERVTKKELLQIFRYLEPQLSPAPQAAVKAPAIPAKQFVQPGTV